MNHRRTGPAAPRKVRALAGGILLQAGFFTFLLVLLVPMAACDLGSASPTLPPDGSPTPSPRPTATPIPTPTPLPPTPTPNSDPPLQYRLMFLQDLVLLVPLGRIEPGDFVWRLSDGGDEWVPAICSVTRIGVVPGTAASGTEGQAAVVYQVRIGEWTGYQAWMSPPAEGEAARVVLDGTFRGTSPAFALRSRDLWVLAIFDELHAVGADGSLRRITSRSAGGYEYEREPRTPTGSDLPWAWAASPVCDRSDSRIFYLSSREGASYSIWVVDPDRSVESRFGPDRVAGLEGVADGQLVASAVLGPVPAPGGRRYAVDDSADATDQSEDEWHPVDGWLVQSGGTGLLMSRGSRWVRIESPEPLVPLLLGDGVLWFRQASGDDLFRIRLDDRTCSRVYGEPGLFRGRARFLDELAAGEMSWDLALGQGFVIEMTLVG